MYIQADNAVDRTLDDDAQVTTHSTHIPVNNETEAAAVFDDLSYTKAGAVLRMFEQYVGPDKFQGAMQHYFRTHQYMAFSAKISGRISAPPAASTRRRLRITGSTQRASRW